MVDEWDFKSLLRTVSMFQVLNFQIEASSLCGLHSVNTSEINESLQKRWKTLCSGNGIASLRKNF